MTDETEDLAQVRCRMPGCKFVSSRSSHPVRWAQWSAHYLADHYDPRWTIPCPEDGCPWSSRAASTIDHQRAHAHHATDEHGVAA